MFAAAPIALSPEVIQILLYAGFAILGWWFRHKFPTTPATPGIPAPVPPVLPAPVPTIPDLPGPMGHTHPILNQLANILLQRAMQPGGFGSALGGMASGANAVPVDPHWLQQMISQPAPAPVQPPKA